MTPDQVPDELAELLGQKLYDEQSEGCAAPGCQGHPGPVECRNWARDLLAAVLAADRAAERAKVAEMLRDHAAGHRRTAERRGAMQYELVRRAVALEGAADRIARGEER